uniref:Col_cuticle_N domain-containing protein n=1 Tax=Heterorhabditis bacteriophora TaxID=37862 RepID=A0A1I7W759_HETBA
MEVKVLQFIKKRINYRIVTIFLIAL